MKNGLIGDAWSEQQFYSLHEFPPHRAEVFFNRQALEVLDYPSAAAILRVFSQVTSSSEDYKVVCKRIKYSYGSLIVTDVTCTKTNGKLSFLWPWTGLG